LVRKKKEIEGGYKEEKPQLGDELLSGKGGISVLE